MAQAQEKLYKAYIGGKWVEAENTIQVTNPVTGEAFAQVAAVSRAQVKTALETAQAALPAWRAITAKDRGALLHRVADEMNRRADEIAHTITLENGKPLARSRGEVAMTEDHLRWFAEESGRAYGRMIPHQVQGKRNFTDAFLETKHVSIGGI
jgi:succinate-semialdehyde dehydrogenase/glutarate-semialdehyde dehydrogenase